jgi:predicted transcriptional regulator
MRTLRDELIVYFLLNPDDTLTVSDICVKFSRNRSSINEALRTSASDGLLQRERLAGNYFTYSIGPWLKERLATLQPRNSK